MTNDTRPTARSGSTGRAGGRGPVAIVAAVTALALGGVATSVGSVVGHSNRQVVHATGESVPTSFGVVAVEFANVLTDDQIPTKIFFGFPTTLSGGMLAIWMLLFLKYDPHTVPAFSMSHGRARKR